MRTAALEIRTLVLKEKCIVWVCLKYNFAKCTALKDVKRMWQSLHEDILQNNALMEHFLKGQSS